MVNPVRFNSVVDSSTPHEHIPRLNASRELGASSAKLVWPSRIFCRESLILNSHPKPCSTQVGKHSSWKQLGLRDLRLNV